MAETTVRGRRTLATRARIADAALKLFLDHGYAETTINEIAEAAGVSRRTVFHHFPTKAAMLFDHLVTRREEALQRLRERPPAEPILASLHAVLRALCEQGYDRRLLAQIRAVMATEPQFAGDQFSLVSKPFMENVISTLENRPGQRHSALEVRALTRMAFDWVVTAAHVYLVEDRPSLVACFDEVVETCVQAATQDFR